MGFFYLVLCGISNSQQISDRYGQRTGNDGKSHFRPAALTALNAAAFSWIPL
jgi:hypothetical protein